MNSPPHRPSVRQRNEAYLSRFLVALTAVLVLSVVAFRLPLSLPDTGRVGWQVIAKDEVIALENVRFEDGLSAPPGFLFSAPDPIPASLLDRSEPRAGEQDGTSDDAPGTEGLPQPNRVERMERLVLAAAETMPEIRGGLGAYYINIEYPQQAIDAGIQGRLVLDFIVERDGRPSEIQVYKSLHPMCDSAAVRALRKTIFMPGKSGGETVAVRMRLPVLFQILPSAGQADSLGTTRVPG